MAASLSQAGGLEQEAVSCPVANQGANEGKRGVGFQGSNQQLFTTEQDLTILYSHFIDIHQLSYILTNNLSVLSY